MKKIFTNIPIILISSVLTTYFSIRKDLDSSNSAWFWFQRSGSLVVLFGAFLTYRSLFREGYKGYGGVNTTVLKGTVVGHTEDGKIKMKYDDDSIRLLNEQFWDQVSGYIGTILIIYGTIIWGYGDLLERLMNIII